MKPSFLVSLLFSYILHNFSKCNCNSIHRQSENHARNGVSYIVGGEQVHISEYPWIVSLNYLGHHICGGSIITATRVVTAAHCARDVNASLLKIRAGSSLVNGDGQVISVTEYVIHPRYNQKNVQNDIAILFLASELEMSYKVGVISLPEQDDFLTEGTDLQVAGWGRISEQGSPSEVLLAITVQAVEHNRCVNIYKWVNTVTDSMMCAGVESGKQSPCYGDSGGPLSYNNETLVGIVSWGAGCAKQGKPIVFTRVAAYTDWIKSHMGSDV